MPILLSLRDALIGCSITPLQPTMQGDTSNFSSARYDPNLNVTAVS